MQQGSGNQYPLFHSLRIIRERRILRCLKRQQLQRRSRLVLDQRLRHAAQSSHQLQVLEARKMGVYLRFLRNVPEYGAIRSQIVLDIFSPEEDVAFRWPDHPDHHLHRGRFTRPIRPQVPQDFALFQDKTHIFDRRNTAVAFENMPEFEHDHPLCSILLNDSVLHR